MKPCPKNTGSFNVVYLTGCKKLRYARTIEEKISDWSQPHLPLLFAHVVANIDLAGDPTAVVWATFALYLLASACCLRRGRSSHRTKSAATGSLAWRSHSAALFLLGLNKQLDLQTTLNRLGGHLARSAGWEDYRREIQLLFFTGLIAGICLALLKHLLGVRTFFRSHPLVTIGDALIGAYVLIRVFCIEHVDERILGYEFKDMRGLWIIEVFGLVLLLAGATSLWRRNRHVTGD